MRRPDHNKFEFNFTYHRKQKWWIAYITVQGSTKIIAMESGKTKEQALFWLGVDYCLNGKKAKLQTANDWY